MDRSLALAGTLIVVYHEFPVMWRRALGGFTRSTGSGGRCATATCHSDCVACLRRDTGKPPARAHAELRGLLLFLTSATDQARSSLGWQHLPTFSYSQFPHPRSPFVPHCSSGECMSQIYLVPPPLSRGQVLHPPAKTEEYGVPGPTYPGHGTVRKGASDGAATALLLVRFEHCQTGLGR